MVAVRVSYSGNSYYETLVWNLLLAWIPFALAVYVYDGRRRGGRGPLLWAAGVLWLVLLPERPVHRHGLQVAPGLDRRTALVRRRPRRCGRVVRADARLHLALPHASGRSPVDRHGQGVALRSRRPRRELSSGIYLGRFQRWNSWDVFTQPGHFARNVWPHVAQPYDHPKTVAVTALFTAFLAMTYLVFYSFAELEAGEPTKR